jgi:hypothetical protein
VAPIDLKTSACGPHTLFLSLHPQAGGESSHDDRPGRLDAGLALGQTGARENAHHGWGPSRLGGAVSPGRPPRDRGRAGSGLPGCAGRRRPVVPPASTPRVAGASTRAGPPGAAWPARSSRRACPRTRRPPARPASGPSGPGRRPSPAPTSRAARRSCRGLPPSARAGAMDRARPGKWGLGRPTAVGGPWLRVERLAGPAMGEPRAARGGCANHA